MSNPSLADPLSLGMPVPRNNRCSGKALVLITMLIGMGLAMLLLVPRSGDAQGPAIAMPSIMQPARVPWFPQVTGARQFMQQTRAWPVTFADGQTFLKMDDKVTHKKRGEGKVIAVDPSVQVKYDNDPEPVFYEDDDGKPLPEDVLREKLTLVTEAPSESD